MTSIRPKDLPRVTTVTAGDSVIMDGATARSILTTDLLATTAFIQIGTGAVSRTMQNKSRDWINAKDFGVVADGVTDDTAAMAAAIAATPAGGTLVLPTAAIKVKGSGSAIFTITNPINILGQGMDAALGGGSIFSLDSTVPTTRDLFHVVGVTNNTLRGYTFKNFNVQSLGGPAGRHVFHFDTTAGTTTNLAEVVIDSVFCQDQASAGGNSVFLNNGTGTNTNGGTFNVTVQKSYLGGGFSTAYAGDSIRLYDNIISTASAAVTLNQVSGAGNFLMVGNNVSGTAGGVVVSQSVAPVIAFNEFEQQATNTEANNAIIDLTGSIANISSAKIFGNQVQANTGTGNPTLLRIGAATGTYYNGNRFGTPVAYSPVIITASASGTVIGAGNQYVGVSVNFTDAGSGTVQGTVIAAAPNVFGQVYSAGGSGLVSTAALTNGQVLVGQTGAAPLPKTVSGDATLAASGALTVTKINGNDQTTAWTAYTPTVTAATGTPTTVSATGRFKQIGKTVFVQARAAITTVGTATGALIMTLPLASAAFDYAGCGVETSSTGKSCAVFIASGTSTSQVRVLFADATTTWANGNSPTITMMYEVP